MRLVAPRRHRPRDVGTGRSGILTRPCSRPVLDARLPGRSTGILRHPDDISLTPLQLLTTFDFFFFFVGCARVLRRLGPLASRLSAPGSLTAIPNTLQCRLRSRRALEQLLMLGQYRVHGTASRRFSSIGAPSTTPAPNVPLSSRCNASLDLLEDRGIEFRVSERLALRFIRDARSATSPGASKTCARAFCGPASSGPKVDFHVQEAIVCSGSSWHRP